MTTYLILMTTGPVQEFIAQARRTRDLWFGSHLLSEISKAAAASLHSHGARLVFPGIQDADLERYLMPSDSPLDQGEPVFNVANRIVAQLETDVPDQIVAKVRSAVRARWQALAKAVWDRAWHDKLVYPDAGDVWNEQVEGLIEFQAAWSPLESAGAYSDALEALDETIEARKSLRNFQPWKVQHAGRPRSSLDGARETVLRKPDESTSPMRVQFRIQPGEQLDAVGLIKRAGGKPEQFLSVHNVALAAWTRHAALRAPEELEALRAAPDLPKRVRGLSQRLAWVRRLPLDGGLLLPEQWPALARECELKPEQMRQLGERYVMPLLKKAGRPQPYVAAIVADGDRMGEALRQMHSWEEHRAFSIALAGFAGRAREVIEHECDGLLIYAGGDDVLCFIAVSESVRCARRLREVFDTCMDIPALRGLKVRPSLSVGIGIGHVLESMSMLLELGRIAEKLAKGDVPAARGEKRNALALVLDKRSGDRRQWRGRWDGWLTGYTGAAQPGEPAAPAAGATSPTGATSPAGAERAEGAAERLEKDLGLFREDALSTRKIYQVQAALHRLRPPDRKEHREAAHGWTSVLLQEARRILARNDLGPNAPTGWTPLTPEEVGLHLPEEASWDDLSAAVDAWCDRLLISRHLFEATPSSQRKETA